MNFTRSEIWCFFYENVRVRGTITRWDYHLNLFANRDCSYEKYFYFRLSRLCCAWSKLPRGGFYRCLDTLFFSLLGPRIRNKTISRFIYLPTYFFKYLLFSVIQTSTKNKKQYWLEVKNVIVFEAPCGKNTILFIRNI